MCIVEDPDWLLAHLHTMTDGQETHRDTPWKVDDAPSDYIEKMVRGIVGLEIPITRLDGKWKMSQNRYAADRAGVVAGLTAEETEIAAQVAGNIPD